MRLPKLLRLVTLSLVISSGLPTPTSNLLLTPSAAQAQTVEEKETQPEKKESTRQIIARLEEEAKKYNAENNYAEEVECLSKIGAFYSFLGENIKALETLQKALDIAKKLGNLPQEEIVILNTLGNTYSNLGEYQKALEVYQQSIPIGNNIEELVFKIVPLQGMTLVYWNMGETQKTFELEHQMLSLSQAAGDRKQQASTLANIATQYMSLGEFFKAADYIQQAKAIDANAVNANLESLMNYSLGRAGRTDDAKSSVQQRQENIEHLEQLAQKYRSENEYFLEAQILGLLGVSYNYYIGGNYQKAFDIYQRRLELMEYMGNLTGKSETITSLAELFDQWDKKQQALDYFNQSLKIQQQIGNRPGEANTYNSMAGLYQSMGAYAPSLELYKKALSLYQSIGDRTSKIMVLQSLGYVYLSLEDRQQALKSHQEQVSISQATGNRQGEVLGLVNLSRTYRKINDYPQALKLVNEALSLSRTYYKDKDTIEVIVLSDLGLTYQSMKDYPKALESMQQAIDLGRKIGGQNYEATWLYYLGNIYEENQQPQKALQAYNQALSLNRDAKFLAEEASTRYQIAKLEQKQGNLSQSLSQIDQAIRIIESIRKEVASPDLKTSFFASKQDYYQLKIDILMQLHQQNPNQGYDAQAFSTSESSRARTLLELLTESNIDIRQGVDPSLLEQEKNLQYQLIALQKRRLELISNQATPEILAQLDPENTSLLSQYQDIQAQIRATSPRYAALTQPQPLNLAQVQQQVLDPDTVLLQYSLGKEKSYLWVVTQNEITTYTLPPEAEIKALVEDLRLAILRSPDRLERINQASSQLSQVILFPATEKLTKKRIAVVADGALNYIPFSVLTLPNTTKPLITAYEIVNLPSSSSLALIRKENKHRNTAPKTIAILADPVFNSTDTRVSNPRKEHSPLETSNLNQIALQRTTRSLENGSFDRLSGTSNEAKGILNLIPDPAQTSSAFGFQANYTNATSSQLKQYQVIHFATHGILNTEYPELSGVVFSLVDEKGNPINGFLRLHEIFNLELNADLVVISACETGLGKEVKGEGLVGLTRGFMYAGSPRILVSLWKVSDAATSEMMQRFYRLLWEEKLFPPKALRQAQLEMQTETQWVSPYYWSAFVLQGDWR